jgi:ankyrin repeat protein
MRSRSRNIKPTSIILATENGLIDDVQYLLKKGYDPNSKNDKGETPLILAIRNSYTDIAKLLIENGARIDGDTFYDILTAMAYRKKEIIIELLLESKYRPSDKEIVEYLIDNNEQYTIAFLLKSKLIKFPFP